MRERVSQYLSQQVATDTARSSIRYTLLALAVLMLAGSVIALWAQPTLVDPGQPTSLAWAAISIAGAATAIALVSVALAFQALSEQRALAEELGVLENRLDGRQSNTTTQSAQQPADPQPATGGSKQSPPSATEKSLSDMDGNERVEATHPQTQDNTQFR
jgi:hypothetical protein